MAIFFQTCKFSIFYVHYFSLSSPLSYPPFPLLYCFHFPYIHFLFLRIYMFSLLFSTSVLNLFFFALRSIFFSSFFLPSPRLFFNKKICCHVSFFEPHSIGKLAATSCDAEVIDSRILKCSVHALTTVVLRGGMMVTPKRRPSNKHEMSSSFLRWMIKKRL